MKRFAALLAVVGVFGGCATQSSTMSTAPAPAAAVGQVPAVPALYRGEVWTWDPTINVVTLMQGDQKVRILVTPDQLIGLKARDIVAVRGVPAAPAEIERFATQMPAMRAVPTGALEQTEVTGSITAVDPSGKVSIATSRGPLDVWVATPVSPQFRVGGSVRVKSALQGVTYVPLNTVVPGSIEPAALAGGEPGDYAVINGRILALEPTGRITIESPRGPINVWVADASRYALGQPVQVRTSVRTSP